MLGFSFFYEKIPAIEEVDKSTFTIKQESKKIKNIINDNNKKVTVCRWAKAVTIIDSDKTDLTFYKWSDSYTSREFERRGQMPLQRPCFMYSQGSIVPSENSQEDELVQAASSKAYCSTYRRAEKLWRSLYWIYYDENDEFSCSPGALAITGNELVDLNDIELGSSSDTDSGVSQQAKAYWERRKDLAKEISKCDDKVQSALVLQQVLIEYDNPLIPYGYRLEARYDELTHLVGYTMNPERVEKWRIVRFLGCPHHDAGMCCRLPFTIPMCILYCLSMLMMLFAYIPVGIVLLFTSELDPAETLKAAAWREGEWQRKGCDNATIRALSERHLSLSAEWLQNELEHEFSAGPERDMIRIEVQRNPSPPRFTSSRDKDRAKAFKGLIGEGAGDNQPVQVSLVLTVMDTQVMQ